MFHKPEEPVHGLQTGCSLGITLKKFPSRNIRKGYLILYLKLDDDTYGCVLYLTLALEPSPIFETRQYEIQNRPTVD